ncbi:MAG: ABC transporter ATP-binding protein [Fibrobacteria bacterium]|nr:ABC transporter ATP-binding protein [Fibrobacteria bacterium]
MGASSLLSARINSFCYRNGSPGLENFTLTVHTGDVQWITGPSGCGKTTALRCLSGLIPRLYAGEFDGKVCMQGVDMQTLPGWKIPEYAGVLLQNPTSQFLTDNVYDEILFGLQLSGKSEKIITERAESMIECLTLSHLLKRNPRDLSSGEQQRVMLAALLGRAPAMLLLDEPFGRLDKTSRKELLSWLENFKNQGNAVVAFDHSILDPPFPGHQVITMSGIKGQKVPSRGALSEDIISPCIYKDKFSIQLPAMKQGNVRLFESQKFVIEPGEAIGLTGPNGSGKSTLLRTLCAGSGRGLEVAMVFENPDLQFFCASVAEEFSHIPKALGQGELLRLLEVFGLKSYLEIPPLLLSEGEKKRLGMALAIALKPSRGFVLDEPTLGLDNIQKQLMGDVIRLLTEGGYFVVVASHDTPWLNRVCPRQFTLGDGELRERKPGGGR